MILLGTHVVVWAAIAPERLSRPAARAIRRAGPEGVPLITADEAIRSSASVRTIW